MNLGFVYRRAFILETKTYHGRSIYQNYESLYISRNIIFEKKNAMATYILCVVYLFIVTIVCGSCNSECPPWMSPSDSDCVCRDSSYFYRHLLCDFKTHTLYVSAGTCMSLLSDSHENTTVVLGNCPYIPNENTSPLLYFIF